MKLGETETCHRAINSATRLGVGVGGSFRTPLGPGCQIGGWHGCGFLAAAGRHTFAAEIRQRRCELGYSIWVEVAVTLWDEKWFGVVKLNYDRRLRRISPEGLTRKVS